VQVLLFSLIVASGPSAAAGWSDFEDAFPELPCHDGWAGCVVDGQEVSAQMHAGSEGVPLPSSMRLDWFSLEATPTLSPFVILSDYPTQLAQVAPRPRQQGRPGPDPQPREMPADGPGHDRSVDRTTTPGPGPVAPPDRSGAGHDGVADASGGQHSTSSQGDPAPVGPRLPPAQILTADQATQQQADPTPPPATTPDPQPVSQDAVVDMAPIQEADDSCDDLVSLEPAALMGTLSGGQQECLEARIVSASRQTEKDKVSRVLLMDAEARGDKKAWARLMRRHLEDIDRSDPDLCFKYAYYLSRGGVNRAHGVVRWADYALENKAQWSGSTFVSRVYALLKLKAEAANRIWQSTEEAYVQNRTDENEANTTKYRDLTKVYAREWLDYARVSGQDTKNALALCVSAAGNRSYCEGG